MNLSSGVSLGQLLISLGVLFLTSGVAWGTLLQRVHTLEKQVDKLADLPERLAKLETTAKNTEGMVTTIFNRLIGETRTFDQKDEPRRR
jgi:hypothetical protein